MRRLTIAEFHAELRAQGVAERRRGEPYHAA